MLFFAIVFVFIKERITDDMEANTIFILIIIFIATLIRSTFGFGESLVAVPLLLLFLPVEIAVPLSVLLSIFIAAVVVVQDHQQIHFSSAKWLILFALPGIPLGLFILVYGNGHFVKSGLGLLIILYSTYSLLLNKKQYCKKTIAFGFSFAVFFPGFSVALTA